MVDKIYSRQSDESDEGLKRDAAEIGLDQARFTQCLMSGATASRVRQDLADGNALGVGVSGTPTFFVGQQRIEDVPSLAELSERIDQELAAHGMATPPGGEPPVTSPSSESKKPESTASAPGKVATGKALGTQPAEATSLFAARPGGFFSSVQGSSTTCSEAEANKKQPTLIGNSELRQLLSANPKPVFVDVRPRKEYAAGKIPGAINIPVDDMEQQWSSLPKDRVIVLYESGRSSGDICAASRAAGRILLEHGIPSNQVKVYQDGLAGWQKSDLSAKK
jgi:rhodanese-related sulfurtransferase